MQMKCFENVDKWQWASSMYPEADVEMIESSALRLTCINKLVTSIQKFAICDWRECRCILVFSNFDINVHQHARFLTKKPIYNSVFTDFEVWKH